METNSDLMSNNFSLLINQNGANERDKLVPPIINPIYSFLNSEESQQVVCFDGYYYVLTRANDKRAYYKCRNNLCTGRGVSIAGAFTCIKFHKPGCTPQALMCDNTLTVLTQIDDNCYLQNGLDDLTLEFTQYNTKPDVESLLNSFTQLESLPANEPKLLDSSNLILPPNVNFNEAAWQPYVNLEPLPISYLTTHLNDLPGGVKFSKTNKALWHDKKQYVLVRYDEAHATSYYKCRNFPCGARGFCNADNIFQITSPHNSNCQTSLFKRARTSFKHKDRHHSIQLQTGSMYFPAALDSSNSKSEIEQDWSDEISETELPQAKTNLTINEEPKEIDLTKWLEDMGHLEAPTTDIKFIRSNKGRAVLCHGPHQYTQHHRNYKGHTFYYKCRNKDCNARGILKGNTFVPTKSHDFGCDVLNASRNEGMRSGGSETKSSLRFSLCPHVGEQLITHAGLSYRPSPGPTCSNKIYYACTDAQCSGRAVLTFRPVRSHTQNCQQIGRGRAVRNASDAFANTLEDGPAMGEEFPNAITATNGANYLNEGLNTTGLDEKTGQLYLNPPNNADIDPNTGPTTTSGVSGVKPFDSSEITYIASSNGKPMAYHLGYLYINDRNYHDHMYYRCHRAPHCPGRGKIIGSTRFDLTQLHNHATDVNKFMGLETRNKLKEAVLSNPSQSLKKTYDQVMNRRKLEVANIEAYPYALPRYKTVQRSMGKLLNKIRLAFPNYREMFYN